MDSAVLIIYYQPEEYNEEVSKNNEVGVGVIAKDTLMNHNYTFLTYLWKLQRYFLNRSPNEKQLFSKFRISHNITIEDIILTLKKAIEEFNFFL